MLLIVDRHNGIPAYRQIMDQIRFQISSAVLTAGEEMPSTRGLSAELGLNPMTISKAYGYLEQEGVLERRPGRPLVVCGTSLEVAEEHKLEQLRSVLLPVVTVIRQLGMNKDQATAALGQLLDESSSEGTN
ncbi:MAG: GntR family transcriptional regulator [Planctomycetota bacterium]|jgi:GntR family transcriptional regulator